MRTSRFEGGITISGRHGNYWDREPNYWCRVELSTVPKINVCAPKLKNMFEPNRTSKFSVCVCPFGWPTLQKGRENREGGPNVKGPVYLNRGQTLSWHVLHTAGCIGGNWGLASVLVKRQSPGSHSSYHHTTSRVCLALAFVSMLLTWLQCTGFLMLLTTTLPLTPATSHNGLSI